MVKLGKAPAPEELQAEDSDWYELDPATVLWRVHRSAGFNVVPWNALRYWGPSAARFDPHEPTLGARDQDIGVSYTATDVPSALAEVFQDRRVVNATRQVPYLTAWRPVRSLRLLDLTAKWPVRNGASHAINTGRHDLCRAWARSIYERWPTVDGLLHTSAMAGNPCVCLWTAAGDSFPPAPTFSRPLADPGLRLLVESATAQIGFRLI